MDFIVHGIAESQTPLSKFHSLHSHVEIKKKKCIFDAKFTLLKKISWYFYMSFVNLKILPNHVDSEPDAKQK